MGQTLRVRFQGQEYWLIAEGAGETLNGALATEAAFKAGEVSYAHLYENGIIRRYNKEIGRREDLEILGPTEPLTAEEEASGLWGTLFKEWPKEEGSEPGQSRS